MANLSKVVCHGESDKSRFGNPPQESNFQRLGITPHRSSITSTGSVFVVRPNGRACAFRDTTARLRSKKAERHRGTKHGTIHKTTVRRAATRRAYRVLGQGRGT